MRFPILAGCVAVSLCAVFLADVQSQQRRNQPKSALPQEDNLSQRERQNKIGETFNVTLETMKTAYAEPSVRNASVILPRNGAKPKVPEGFEATLFASGLDSPRQLTILPNGDVIVAIQKSGTLMLLRDSDKDGQADWISRYSGGYNAPYGLAYREGEVLVADQDGIWRIPHTMGNVRGSYGQTQPADKVPLEERKPKPNADRQELLTEKGAFGEVVGHRNRELAIGPDGRLYVGVGSGGNISVEPPVKATVQVFSASGTGQETLVKGVRNPTGLAFHPETKELWVAVQERDHMGDTLVPDYLIQPKKGEDYGWPYSYMGGNKQPEFDKIRETKSDGAAETKVPMPPVLFEAHSAVMGIAFVTGGAFPEDYKGDLIAALKGSWNRNDPVGYKLVRVRFENGKPTGSYENFMTGFWVSGDQSAEVWGRPSDVAFAPDGSLFVVDDTGGTIWKVTYRKPENRQQRADR